MGTQISARLPVKRSGCKGGSQRNHGAAQPLLPVFLELDAGFLVCRPAKEQARELLAVPDRFTLKANEST